MSQLTKSLSHKDENVRLSAAKALGQIGPQAKEAIPALIKALSDENKDVRSRAVYALSMIVPKAKEVAPALIKVLSDNYPFVKSSAAYALDLIDTDWKTKKYDKKTQKILDKYLKEMGEK